MDDKVCDMCRCRICVYNAENNADGMCRNCEACWDNEFKFKVWVPQDCEMWEGGSKIVGVE